MKKVHHLIITSFFILLPISIFAQEYNIDSLKFLQRLQKLERIEKRRVEAKNYGNNIVRFIPLRLNEIKSLGVGIEYERILGAKKLIGITLPITYTRYRSPNYYDYLYFGVNKLNGFYFTPGLKFYPFGQRKVNYAVGPNILFSRGNGNHEYYGNFINYKLGVLVNNYLNIQFSEHLNFGAEIGIGYEYINKFQFDTFKRDIGLNILGNIAISFGYRF